MKEKICFIILHYMVLEDTIKCISSILSLKKSECVEIIVVDNCSPNGSGVELKNRFRDFKQVTVLLNERNEGFSRGNNLGCTYAIEKFKPDYLVVVNNDVEIVQKNFIELIQKEYQASGFDVLAVDIYNPLLKIHQNPLGKECPDIPTVDRTIKWNSILLKRYKLLYPIIRFYFYYTQKRRKNTDYQEYQQGIVPMGACLIFSREMYINKKKIFEPETRFYYEENILALWCKYNEKTIIYTPEISVLHYEGKATKATGRNERVRLKKRMENILESAKIYREELVKGEKDAGSEICLSAPWR